jgi:hypothetical protein
MTSDNVDVPNQSIPYLRLQFIGNGSLLPLYGINLDEDQTPWSTLSDIPIASDHLKPLIETLGFLNDSMRLSEDMQIRSCSKRQFICTACSKFFVRFHRPNKSRVGAKWLLLHISDYHDISCPSTHIVPSKDVLENMSVFCNLVSSAFLLGQKVGVAQVISTLNTLGYSIGVQRSSILRAIELVRIRLLAGLSEKYFRLSNYLRRYVSRNPTAMAVLQMDDHDCFYRMFITIPQASEVFKRLCLPMIFIDGAFSKIPTYDGTIILMYGKSGNGSSIPLCIAWIPSESSTNLCWVMQLLQRANFDIESFPFFTDRGKLLSSVSTLNIHLGVTVSLKYCLEHLIRNIITKFKIKKGEDKHIRHLMASLQGSSSIDQFLKSMDTLLDPNSFHSQSVEIAWYILGIDPSHWTVWANRPFPLRNHWRNIFSDYTLQVCEKLLPDSNYTDMVSLHLSSTIPPGNPFPLFNICRTNLVEGEAFSSVLGGIRTCDPPDAVPNWIVMARKRISTYKQEILDMSEAGTNLSTIGVRLHLKASDTAGVEVDCYEAGPGDEHIFQVSHQLLDGRRFIHNVKSSNRQGEQGMMVCDCITHDMFNSVCRHKMTVARYCHQHKLGPWNSAVTMKLFLSRNMPTSLFYHIESLTWLQNLSPIWEPTLLDTSLPVIATDCISVPPRYRNARGSSTRRFRSLGELGQSHVAPSQRSRAASLRVTTSSMIVQRLALTSTYLKGIRSLSQQEFFDPFTDNEFESDAARNAITTLIHPSRHRLLSCGHCGNKQHIRRCPDYLSGGRTLRESATLLPGAYTTYFPRTSRALVPDELLDDRSEIPYTTEYTNSFVNDLANGVWYNIPILPHDHRGFADNEPNIEEVQPGPLTLEQPSSNLEDNDTHSLVRLNPTNNLESILDSNVAEENTSFPNDRGNDIIPNAEVVCENNQVRADDHIDVDTAVHDSSDDEETISVSSNTVVSETARTQTDKNDSLCRSSDARQLQLPCMTWGINSDRRKKLPGLPNTCALDSFLSFFFILSRNNGFRVPLEELAWSDERMRTEKKQLGTALDLLDLGFSDEPRRLLYRNPPFLDMFDTGKTSDSNTTVDMWSSVGTCFPLLKDSTTWRMKFNKSCDSCAKSEFGSSTIALHQMTYMPPDVSLHLKQLFVTGQTCRCRIGAGDHLDMETLDEGPVVSQSQSSKCRGHSTLKSQVVEHGHLFCYEFSRKKKGLFTDLPRIHKFEDFDLELKGVFLSNGSHFRSIVTLPTQFIRYDGLESPTSIVVPMDIPSHEAESLQGPNFHIVMIVYETTYKHSSASYDDSKVPKVCMYDDGGHRKKCRGACQLPIKKNEQILQWREGNSESKLEYKYCHATSRCIRELINFGDSNWTEGFCRGEYDDDEVNRLQGIARKLTNHNNPESDEDSVWEMETQDTS